MAAETNDSRRAFEHDEVANAKKRWYECLLPLYNGANLSPRVSLLSQHGNRNRPGPYDGEVLRHRPKSSMTTRRNPRSPTSPNYRRGSPVFERTQVVILDARDYPCQRGYQSPGPRRCCYCLIYPLESVKILEAGAIRSIASSIAYTVK